MCDENMLNRGIDGLGDDQNWSGVNEAEHGHISEVNDEEVVVKYMVHDPKQLWNKMKPGLGRCYEFPAQLRFTLTNYTAHNG